MLFRARLIGGSLQIKPGRRGGTIVACSLRRPPSTARQSIAIQDSDRRDAASGKILRRQPKPSRLS
jgi:hypothetical protein